jgi:hypothetical protein
VDFSAPDDGEVDAKHRHRLASLAHLDVGSHPGRDLVALYELVLDHERVRAIIEDRVEIEDAVAEFRQIAFADGRVPDLIGRDKRRELIHRRAGVDIHQSAEHLFLGSRRFNRNVVRHGLAFSLFRLLRRRYGRRLLKSHT